MVLLVFMPNPAESFVKHDIESQIVEVWPTVALRSQSTRL